MAGRADPPRRLIVELVGPAGSGKTALLDHLRRTCRDAFGHAGRAHPSRLKRAGAALAALPTLLHPARLSWRERRRLYEGDRAIRAAQDWLAGLPEGVHLIDEGPHRILHDYACNSDGQLAAWRAIARRRLHELSALEVLVIRLEADRDLRRVRREQRMGPLEQRDPAFNTALWPRQRPLLFLRDELAQLGPQSCAFKRVIAVANTTTLAQTAAGICDVIAAARSADDRIAAPDDAAARLRARVP